jgi:hypothetical protein
MELSEQGGNSIRYGAGNSTRRITHNGGLGGDCGGSEGEEMNASQRVSTWIFAAAIVVSINYAPWERSATITDLGHVTLQELHSEIWEPPIIRNQTPSQNVGEVRLRTEVLIMEWIASLLIYGAVFVVLSDKKRDLRNEDLQTPKPESKGQI